MSCIKTKLNVISQKFNVFYFEYRIGIFSDFRSALYFLKIYKNLLFIYKINFQSNIKPALSILYLIEKSLRGLTFAIWDTYLWHSMLYLSKKKPFTISWNVYKPKTNIIIPDTEKKISVSFSHYKCIIQLTNNKLISISYNILKENKKQTKKTFMRLYWNSIFVYWCK